LRDLLPDGVHFKRDAVSAEDLLPWHKENYPEQFGIVVLDLFKACLQSHRKQASEEHAVAQQEEECFAHDHKFYPRKTHNERGEPVFDMPPAKPLLRQDVKDQMHSLQDIKKATIVEAGVLTFQDKLAWQLLTGICERGEAKPIT
jgi:hypothetical protein